MSNIITSEVSLEEKDKHIYIYVAEEAERIYKPIIGPRHGKR